MMFFVQGSGDAAAFTIKSIGGGRFTPVIGQVRLRSSTENTLTDGFLLIVLVDETTECVVGLPEM
jgi:hypothetical protein